MGFEELWEIYGDKKPERVRSEEEAPQKTEKKTIGHKQEHKQEYKQEHKQEYKKPVTPARKPATGSKQEAQVGVFGNGTRRTAPDSSGNKRPGRPGIDLSALRDLPWLDIVFALVTLFLLIAVIANFERVTDAIFAVLFPLLSNIISFVVVVGLVVVLILWLTRRMRRPRRRW